MFSNFHTKQNVSKQLREYFLKLFATEKDVTGQYKYYNVNDTRFWNCSIWKEIDEMKLREEEFKEEKKNHPENVSGPQF